MFDRVLKPIRWIGEMFNNGYYDVTRAVWYSGSMSAMRSLFSEAFFQRPRMDGTVVNYELARSLYRNDNPSYNLGGGFARPIIDLAVEYMGVPSVSGTADDAFLNECITDYWAPKLQQAWRDAMRDSKSVVRFRQPNLANPLFTEADRMHGKLDILPPEECEIQFDPTDPDMVERATIHHFIQVDERTSEEIVRGTYPRMEEHEIIEIIEPDSYKFFDKTKDAELDTWTTPNNAGFVPCWPIWNDYSSELGGGTSDLEPVLPFIQALHDVLTQALSAHSYHSTPKATFNIKDVTTFLKNNYPSVLNPDGSLIPGAKIEWSGKQIFFMQTDEKVGFVEAKSVLGDSKTLMEFLIDCIAVSSETPRWALLAHEAVVPETDATLHRFEKKIGRKRHNFAESLVMICKMALATNGKLPSTPRIAWPAIRLSELVNKGQAIQQLILAFDAAAAHKWIADETVVKILGTLFSEVNPPDVEMELAKKNVVPAVAPPAPASDTQALPPAGGNGNGNGNGSRSDAKKVVKQLTTSSASKS